MARPSKFNQTRVDAILTALREGNTRRVASLCAGVDQETFSRWLRRYADFASAVEKAEADAEAHHVANIKRAADSGIWTADAWWLERRRNKDWGKVDRVEIINHVRQLAREAGKDEDAAVAEADRYLREIRAGAGR